MIWDISTWSREPCKPSTTRLARGCHPCLRYILLPMSQERTRNNLVCREGFEPSTIRLKVGCSTSELPAHRNAGETLRKCLAVSARNIVAGLWVSTAIRSHPGERLPGAQLGREAPV